MADFFISGISVALGIGMTGRGVKIQGILLS